MPTQYKRTYKTGFRLSKTKESFNNYGITNSVTNSSDYLKTATRIGQTVPGYKQLIKAERDATSYYFRRGSRITKDVPVRGESYVESQTQYGLLFSGVTLVGSMGYSNAFWPDDYSDLDAIGFTIPAVDALAYSKMVSKARDLITPLQGGVFLGQLGKTLEQIRHPAKTLRQGVRDFVLHAKKRAKKESRHSFKKVLADTWLETQYGWRPLLSDIRGANDALKDLAARPSLEMKVVRGVADQVTPLGSTTGDYDVFGQSIVGVSITSKVTFSVMYRAGIALQSPSTLTMNATTLGFDPSNFVPTVWELVPWSFLIDYFTNIGEVLNAWTFPEGRFRWINKTARDVIKRNNISYLVVRGADLRFYSPGSFESEWRFIERFPVTSPPTARFALKTHWPTSIKWLDIAGLIANRNSGPSFRGR